MSDELLPYYNRELTYIRRLAAEFANAHPKIAGRLRLTPETIEDPHVSRLIEAFAYLNARLRHKLDDDFPELSDALLGILYPHYTAPIPSMAIVQFTGQPDQTTHYTVPAGTELESEPVGGETCRFRTCYPATLWPIVIESASLAGRPFVAPANPQAARAGAVACLRLTLRCIAADMTFTQLALDKLRVFLRGQPQEAFPLYELIFNNTVSMALADLSSDASPVLLGPEAIRPVGFAKDEGIIPYPARSFAGYRTLTEYFAFPDKFLFLDLTQLSNKVLLGAGNRLEVFIYLNRTMIELERTVSRESFALGCAPIVNLFALWAEPIQLTRNVSEYRVVAEARRPGTTEVYSLDEVKATAHDGHELHFEPFYSTKHASEREGRRAFWLASRRAAGGADPGTEVYLSLLDLDFNPSQPADTVVSTYVTALNRELPSTLPVGGGHPYLFLVEGAAPVSSVACIVPPSATLRPPLRQRGRWRLISHLALNHLSLSDDSEGADALRDILKLYDFRDSEETRRVIDSIVSVKSRPTVGRAPSRNANAVCRGTEVRIEFDAERFSGSGLFLLAAVLERFLARYATINTFTRLVAAIKGRPGELRRWPPRAGERELL